MARRYVYYTGYLSLLGHADLRMTLRYSHLAPSTLRDAVTVLEPTNLGQPAGNASEVGHEEHKPQVPIFPSMEPNSLVA